MYLVCRGSHVVFTQILEFPFIKWDCHATLYFLSGTYHVLDSIILCSTLFHIIFVSKQDMTLEEDASMPTCNLAKIV